MAYTSGILSLGAEERYFGPSRVLEIDNSTGAALIEFEFLSEINRLPATWAAGYECKLEKGDTVLIAGEERNSIYIIGVIPGGKKYGASYLNESQKIDLGNKAFLKVTPKDNETSSKILKVYSSEKQLILKYDPDSGKTILNTETGDLELSASSGNLKITTENSLILEGRDIKLSGKNNLSFGIKDENNIVSSDLSMDRKQVKMGAKNFNLAAERGRFNVVDTRYSGDHLSAKIINIHLITSKLETLAKTIVEKTTDSFRTVKNLSLLKAFRKRTVLEGSYHLKSKSAILKTEKDFKVKSDKIHLG